MRATSQPVLLTRDSFRDAVLERAAHRCVLCGSQSKLDAHHIVERRLWHDGGYYVENGAAVCEPCHMECERTTVSCEDVRTAAGITTVLLPQHLYDSAPCDKWGNPVHPDGTRSRGELFWDPSVQRVLSAGGVLGLFDPRVKYGRTSHLPWSPGVSRDDRVLRDVSHFEGQRVVVTEKMDGENTTLYRDCLHARSRDYVSRPDRDRMRALHASIRHDIPEQYRVCGENIWGRHSIEYGRRLASFFLVFSVWDGPMALSWEETLEWAELLGLVTVPVLYEGPWNEFLVKGLHSPTRDGDDCEGYVVRLADEFHIADFSRSVAKYVRAGHVTTQAHWTRDVRPNPFIAPVRSAQ